MMEFLQNQRNVDLDDKNCYQPRFYDLKEESERLEFNKLIVDNPHLQIHDEIYAQLKELIELRNPRVRLRDSEIKHAIDQHTNGQLEDYGLWVYFPWSNRMVHLLGPEEFAEVRTNRNQNKILPQEREQLSQKKVGVVGLSVGKTIAVTMAMERSFGEIRLADYDQLDLSNLNRLQTGVHSLGIHKTVIAAREILEIDPYLNVKCFHDGLTQENLESFFTEGGNLDLVVDECDGLDIKIILRWKAREMNIPVLMDMNDRGTLDVERFDLEPDRPILHGMIDHLDLTKIKDLSNIEKIPYILPMLGEDTISPNLKASMLEMGHTLSTWPQLSSSVMLGGAIAADTYRRIMLDQFKSSGRYWVDTEEIMSDEETDGLEGKFNLALSNMEIEGAHKTWEDFIRESSSIENVRNWSVAFDGSMIRVAFRPIYDDHHFSYRTIDLLNIGHLAYQLKSTQPDADISFNIDGEHAQLTIPNQPDFETAIKPEYAYHGTPSNKEIDTHKVKGILGNKGFHSIFIQDEQSFEELTELILQSEKQKHLNESWVNFYMNGVLKEKSDVEYGIDLDALKLSDSAIALMKLGNHSKVIELLNEWQGGDVFKSIYRERSASAKGYFVVTASDDEEDLISKGLQIADVVCELKKEGIGVEPLTSLPLLIANDLNKNLESDFNNVIKKWVLPSKNEIEKCVFIGRII